MVMSGMTYDVASVSLDGDGKITALDATSEGGVKIVVTESNGVSSGTVTDGGTEVGTIAEDNGVLVVTFTDGTTVNL